MERIVILAVSPESGRAMLAALSEFRSELIESADGCEVVVHLGRGDAEMTAALSALEQHINERGGPARIELNERPYVMWPA